MSALTGETPTNPFRTCQSQAAPGNFLVLLRALETCPSLPFGHQQFLVFRDIHFRAFILTWLDYKAHCSSVPVEAGEPWIAVTWQAVRPGVREAPLGRAVGCQRHRSRNERGAQDGLGLCPSSMRDELSILPGALVY